MFAHVYEFLSSSRRNDPNWKTALDLQSEITFVVNMLYELYNNKPTNSGCYLNVSSTFLQIKLCPLAILFGQSSSKLTTWKLMLVWGIRIPGKNMITGAFYFVSRQQCDRNPLWLGTTLLANRELLVTIYQCYKKGHFQFNAMQIIKLNSCRFKCHVA